MSANSPVLSKTEMLNIVDSNMPSSQFAICSDDGFMYKYDKTNTVDPTTGKFRKYSGGGSGIIDTADIMINNYSNPETIIYDNRELNDLYDVTLTNPTNGQVLKYDGTNNVWVNSNEASGGSTATVLTQTLSAGSTTVTFTGLPTTGDHLVDFYSSTGINYTAIDTSTAGQVTLTYDSQAANVTINCKIEEV